MGCSLFGKSCYTNRSAPAPNPDPSRWTLLSWHQYTFGYVLAVKYHDCTNFEGKKIMVYRGTFTPDQKTLDPHFSEEGTGPIARFPPTDQGIEMAHDLAQSLERWNDGR